MPVLKKYTEQFKRMQRWYETFKQMDEGIAHEQSSEVYTDIVYAFFQNCYHLKDWIKNDNSVTLPEGVNIEHFINNNHSMCLLADICNGTKHLTLLDRFKRTDEDLKFDSKKYSLALGGKKPIIAVKWNIKTNSGNLDAFEPATECLHKWEDFIKNQNI